MTTLTIMKARIADDLRRDDLTADIADYITEAIGDFQHKRFYFNETRTNTGTTVSGTQSYTKDSSGWSWIANVIKTDLVHITVGGQRFECFPISPIDLEKRTSNTTSTGQTHSFAFYNKTFAFYPIPADAWEVRWLGVQKVAAPADDDEADNPWMVDAARLIRCQAKGHLYAHVIKAADKASEQYLLAQDALARLEDKTADMVKTGDYIVEAWDPF